MKPLIRLILSCSLLLFAAGTAVAQIENLQGTTPQERADVVTKWMKDNLSLDDKTAAKASAINLAFAEKTQTMMNSEAPRIEKMKSFRQESQARDQQLKAIFTPEQYSAYEEKKTEMRSQLKAAIQQKRQAGQ